MRARQALPCAHIDSINAADGKSTAPLKGAMDKKMRLCRRKGKMSSRPESVGSGEHVNLTSRELNNSILKSEEGVIPSFAHIAAGDEA